MSNDLLKEFSLDLESLCPYNEGSDAGYGYWMEGAQKVIAMLQDKLREEKLQSTPSLDDHADKLAEEAHE